MEHMAPDQTQDPIKLPLEMPDSDAIQAMEKAWRRQDLKRYLMRWPDQQPQPPQAFWDYPWRGLDLGCGFGKYILQVAQQNAERAWLGIDKGSLRGGTMVQRITDSGLPNAFGIHGNAIPIAASFQERSLDQITIFYPNPWWPKKHRGKRWPYHPLLPKLVRLLRSGGQIILASNEKFYLEEWHYSLLHHPFIQDEWQHIQIEPIATSQNRTHFETKFHAQNATVAQVSATLL